MPDNYESLPGMEWQVPPAAVAESHKLGWLNEACEEGIAWLRAQRGYTADWRRSLDIIAGRDTTPASPASEYRSRVNPNPLKRNLREVIGVMSKLRPMWGYSSDNRANADNAEMMNKTTRAWYLHVRADRSVKRALQWAGATGRGWMRPVYRRRMYGTGKGDISLFTYGAPSVLPVQLPASGDWQEAYAVTFLEDMPVAMAHGMFPAHQHRLRPTTSRYWYMNDAVRQASQGNWLRRAFTWVQKRPSDSGLSDLYVPIRYTYVIDLAINTSGQEITMGDPNASWSYKVPYVGQDIPMGRDIRTGHPLTRKADENDARLYPQRRLLISSPEAQLYDGPAFDWHGMLPGVSFCPDEWPWEPIGFSMVSDGYELNEAIKTIARGNMDKIKSQLDMSLCYDMNAVTPGEANAFDPMLPRGRMGYDGSALEGPPFQPAVPPEVLRVEPESLAMVDKLEHWLDSQMALHEALNLAKTRSLGSMDDMEKLMELVGPIIEDMSASMEPPMAELGEMVKYMILQYYTTSRVMQIVGPDGVTAASFDYDPSRLVPSHLPGEDVEQPSAYDSRQRARNFADNLTFSILPNTMHEITQMVMKLGLVQLKKAGIKIDSQTIAESWQIPNYGKIDGSTVLDRVQNEQVQDLVNMARAKAVADELGLTPPAAQPGAPKPNGAAPEGRPATMNAPPSLRSKDGGTRSTIATSK